MNGGYIMIKASDADIYASASRALNIGKPILFYENDTTCYYIDTITIDGDDNIILTKGGKTITIADDNTITSVGDIANPLMENIKDASGNLRFIEGEGTSETISNVEIVYNRWSLSGTHLMIVIAGYYDNTTVSAGTTIARIPVPKWVLDKVATLSTGGRITRVNYPLINDSDQVAGTDRPAALYKGSDDLYINTSNNDATDKWNFRIQFDLLIDNE